VLRGKLSDVVRDQYNDIIFIQIVIGYNDVDKTIRILSFSHLYTVFDE